jgi:uncharacterized Zn finger protein
MRNRVAIDGNGRRVVLPRGLGLARRRARELVRERKLLLAKRRENGCAQLCAAIRLRFRARSSRACAHGGYPFFVKAPPPFANVLHADTIAKLARGAALARGRAYVADGRVKALAKKDGQLVGAVYGTTLYAVSIWIKGDGLGYACSCPAGVEGDFCKHCVAIAVAWVEQNN